MKPKPNPQPSSDAKRKTKRNLRALALFGLSLLFLPAPRGWPQGLGKSPGCLGAPGWDARHELQPPMVLRSAAELCQTLGTKWCILSDVTLRVTYCHTPSAQKHFPCRDLNSPTFCPFRGFIWFIFCFLFFFSFVFPKGSLLEHVFGV